MRRFAALLALTTIALASEHEARRSSLKKLFPGESIVLEGATEPEKGSIRLGFLQDPNFYYLTGWTEPGAKILLTPERDILFLPETSPDRLRYTGAKSQPGDPSLARSTGFDKILPLAKFEQTLKSTTVAAERVAESIQKLRMAKSPDEVAAIQRAADVSIQAHLAAWRRAAPGLREYQIAATMRHAYLDAGCERDAYEPIVAAGLNAVTLHYLKKSATLQAGQLLLMDVGAECASHTADITRTIPLSGKFTPRQRELYDIVLGAQNAAIAAAKPGVPFERLNEIAREYLRKHGKSKSGKPLDEYMTHFLGHGVGLEVHDPTDRKAPLVEGNVITIEPGVYIPEEKTGIRIEDMIVITRDGARNMTAALPREAEAIENFLAQRN